MRSRTLAARCLVSTLILTAAAARPLHPLDILIFDGGSIPMTADQLAAVEEAAAFWEDRFDDPILVAIILGFDPLGNSQLGVTSTALTTHSYLTVRAFMIADADTNDELLAVASLPPLSVSVQDLNGVRSAGSVTLTTANAKALGLGTGLDYTFANPPIGIDAEIIFNSAFIGSFDFDRSDGLGPGLTDFVAVAAHEIGHALGFTSITDVQDLNPGFTLNPQTLDLWRWTETGGVHAIGSDTRRIKAGAAEYYDSVLNNVSLSHGSSQVDPLCGTVSQQCQASHWSDDQGNLMDPSLGSNVIANITADDTHAVDYIGYNKRPLCCFYPVEDGDIDWFDPLGVPPVRVGYPLPPWPQLRPPWANVAWGVTMALGELGKRSGAGFVHFEPGGPITPDVVAPTPDRPGEMNLNPSREPATIRPPALHEMTLVSDGESLSSFRFRATCAQSGCQYDSALGAHGGYRVSGVLDAAGDGLEDIDGRATLILLADSIMIPDIVAGNTFTLDVESTENLMIIDDPLAFGLVSIFADGFESGDLSTWSMTGQ